MTVAEYMAILSNFSWMLTWQNAEELTLAEAELYYGNYTFEDPPKGLCIEEEVEILRHFARLLRFIETRLH